MESALFRCANCGGGVVESGGENRVYSLRRGVLLPIPADFKIPTCSVCHERYFTAELAEQLEAVLEPIYRQMRVEHCRRLLSCLIAQHQTTQRQIECACGVTPSYLSHVLAGRKTASVALTRLLEAYVACPSEFRRQLQGRPWEDPRALLQVSPTRNRPGTFAQNQTKDMWASPPDLRVTAEDARACMEDAA